MKKENNELSQEQYDSMLNHIADLGVRFVNTDFGWYDMRDSFNELCEKSGANKGINLDSTIGRRKLMVQSICIKTISRLPREAVDYLKDHLNDIAEDYTPARSRGMGR